MFGFEVSFLFERTKDVVQQVLIYSPTLRPGQFESLLINWLFYSCLFVDLAFAGMVARLEVTLL